MASERATNLAQAIRYDISSRGEFDRGAVAAIIAEAVAPLVRMASVADICPTDSGCGLCEKDGAELARWRSE